MINDYHKTSADYLSPVQSVVTTELIHGDVRRTTEFVGSLETRTTTDHQTVGIPLSTDDIVSSPISLSTDIATTNWITDVITSEEKTFDEMCKS